MRQESVPCQSASDRVTVTAEHEDRRRHHDHGYAKPTSYV